MDLLWKVSEFPDFCHLEVQASGPHLSVGSWKHCTLPHMLSGTDWAPASPATLHSSHFTLYPLGLELLQVQDQALESPGRLWYLAISILLLLASN